MALENGHRMDVKTMFGKTLRTRNRMWGKKFAREMYSNRYMYLLLLPVMAYFLIFKYIPMYGITIAFKDFRFVDGISGSSWAGLKHFAKLFTSVDFYRIMKNTLLLNIYNMLFTFPAPIILAFLMNEVRKVWFKRTIQSVLYIPHFVSWVVLGGIVINLLSPSSGAVNMFLAKLGVTPIYFMKDPFWWTMSYIGSSIWQSAGWDSIIYLAAITSIDVAQYEAATIDGASKLRQMYHITLPGIRGTIAIMLILRMGRMLDVGFEQIYILQNDAVRNISEVISTYEYRLGLESMQYSYTTALGLFKGLIGFALVYSTNSIVRSMGESSIW